MKGKKKEFLWIDKSGRGATNIFSLRKLQKAMKGERSYNDEAASSWADFAEIGDQWENAANKITRTK